MKRKRIFSIIIAVAVLVLLLVPVAIPAAAHTEDEPLVVDLIADGNLS